MPGNEYHFTTRWQVEATVKEVTDILSDAPDLARWWPSVYLDVQALAPGDASGVGKVIGLYTKGWLPYTLRWQFRVTEISSTPHPNPPHCGEGTVGGAGGDFLRVSCVSFPSLRVGASGCHLPLATCHLPPTPFDTHPRL